MAQQYERSAVRRRQIADAALEVIAELGLRGFTTQAVATRVGITDGTIFRHFKNKQEIVLAAMDQLEDVMFSEPLPTDSDPVVRLEEFFRSRAALLGGMAPMGRLMFSEQLVHAAGGAGREKLRTWRQRNLAFVGSCLTELADEGRLQPGMAPRELTRVVQGLLLTFSFERMLAETILPDLDKRIDQSWQTLRALLVDRQ
jgi:AcrR family transcriptional regulator